MILLIYFRKSARVGKLGKNRQIIPNYSERNPGGISGIWEAEKIRGASTKVKGQT